MPVICIGPVCIPLHMIFAFLVGLAHQYGYLKWFKQEWVTFGFWRDKIWGPKPKKGQPAQREAGLSTGCAACSTAASGPAPGKEGGTNPTSAVVPEEQSGPNQGQASGLRHRGAGASVSNVGEE